MGSNRLDCVSKFSWAVPCHTALEKIIEWTSTRDGSRILEIGSGLGYWASLLQAYGADIIAIDTGTESRDEPMFPYFPATIQGCGIEYLKSHDGCPDRALFLCWPRTHNGDAILGAYKGSTVIWIGENVDALGILTTNGNAIGKNKKVSKSPHGPLFGITWRFTRVVSLV